MSLKLLLCLFIFCYSSSMRTVSAVLRAHFTLISSTQLSQTHEPLENGFSSDFSQHYCAGTTATSVERDSTVINQFRASNPNTAHGTTHLRDLTLLNSQDLTYFCIT